MKNKKWIPVFDSSIFRLQAVTTFSMCFRRIKNKICFLDLKNGLKCFNKIAIFGLMSKMSTNQNIRIFYLSKYQQIKPSEFIPVLFV